MANGVYGFAQTDLPGLQQIQEVGVAVAQSSLLGLQQIMVGTAALGLGTLGMARDCYYKETTFLDLAGNNPRGIAHMGAIGISDGLRNLLPVTCLFLGTALFNRHVVRLI